MSVFPSHSAKFGKAVNQEKNGIGLKWGNMVGDTAPWWSECLTRTRLWVWFPSLRGKRKKTKIKQTKKELIAVGLRAL